MTDTPTNEELMNRYTNARYSTEVDVSYTYNNFKGSSYTLTHNDSKISIQVPNKGMIPKATEVLELLVIQYYKGVN